MLCICLFKMDETLVERLWGLTEMFPETVRTGAEVSAQYSVSLIRKLYRYMSEALQSINEQGNQHEQHILNKMCTFQFLPHGALGGNYFFYDPGAASCV